MIGILALQGAFAEHRNMLSAMGEFTRLVRLPEHLDGLAGLILPGGESSCMRLLAHDVALTGALRDFAALRPVWGVCAGLILLARAIGGEEPVLGLMDMVVERNAYGRQRDSFVTDLRVAEMERPDKDYPAVFIRAPRIRSAGSEVTVLASHEGEPVALRQHHLLATAFHPELTGDTRLHALFLGMCRQV